MHLAMGLQRSLSRKYYEAVGSSDLTWPTMPTLLAVSQRQPPPALALGEVPNRADDILQIHECEPTLA